MPKIDESLFERVNVEEGVVDEKNPYAHRYETWLRKSLK